MAHESELATGASTPENMADKEVLKTARTEIGRRSSRGRYDRETVYQILDEAWICHVGFVFHGSPFVLPMAYGRQGDQLVLHGAVNGRLMSSLAGGIDVCAEVTLVDGLVFARSTFHSSVNYRSVVILGRAVLLEGEEKVEALGAVVEHLMPGRSADARPSTVQELRATAVLSLPIHEASAKIRSGPPGDAEKDLDLPIWAGVVPLETRAGAPITAPDMRLQIGAPEYARHYRRPGRGHEEDRLPI